MKYYLILLLLLFKIVGYSQNFNKNYYILNDIDSGTKVLPFNSGYLIQFFGQDVSTQNDYYLGLIETDSKGDLIQKTIFDSLLAEPVIMVENNNVTLAGSFNHFPPYAKKIILIQTDPSGLISKQNTVNFETGFHFTKELEFINNHYYVTDQINYKGDSFINHIWTPDSINIIVFDTSFQFKKSITCPLIVPILYNSSTIIHDSNYFVCALSEEDTSAGDIKHYVIAFDSIGNQKWKYTSPKNVSPFQKPEIETIKFSDKSTAILMPYENDSVLKPEQQILKFDNTGVKKWQHDEIPIYKEGTQELVSMFKTKNEDIVAVGTQIFAIINDNRRTGVIMRLNNQGQVKWKRRVWDINTPFGQSGFNGGVELEDGSLLITGWWRDSLGEPNYDTNVWLIKLDSMGCYNPGCTGDDIITSDQNIILISKDLLKLSPNPAQDKIEVSWSSTPSEAKYIIIYNLDGREITKLPVLGKSGKSIFDISSFISGVYLVKVFGNHWESSPEKFIKK